MRNLKRALSLALASVMVLGLMVVGSGASYSDVTSEQNQEAIEVLQAVGIMVGDDNGNFNPEAKVTRNEMAVVMSNLMDYRVASYAGTSPFVDVPAWAEPYVAACWTNGITSGYTATTYGGSDTVTTAQAALMLMKALGYFQYQSDFADDWQLATVKQANKIDLFDDVDSGVQEAMTRNDLAQLVLNTLEAGIVEDDNDVTKVEAGDVKVETGSVKYYYQTSEKDYATSIDNLSTINLSGQTGTIIELGEKLYSGDLEKEETSDNFGRPATQWTYKSAEIGTYADSADKSWTGKVTYKDLYQAAGSAAYDNYDWSVYRNGRITVSEKDGTTELEDVDGKTVLAKYGKTSTERWQQTGDGVLTEIFVDSDTKEVVVSMVDQFVGKVTKVEKNDEDDYTITVAYKVSRPSNAEDTFDTDNGNFEKDDIVVFTVGDTEIESMAKAQIVDGEVTGVKTADYIELDGTKYVYNRAYTDKDSYGRFGKGMYDLDDSKHGDPEVEDDVIVYLDIYGNAVAFEGGSINLDDYLFVTGIDSAYGDVSIKAYFADGREEKIDIDEIDNVDAVYTDDNDDDNDVLPEKWHIYKYSKSGSSYDLETVKDTYTFTGVDIERDSAAISGNGTPFTDYQGNAVQGRTSFTTNSDTVFINTKDDKMWVGYKNVSTQTNASGALVVDDGIVTLAFVYNVESSTKDDNDYVYVSDSAYTTRSSADGEKTYVIAGAYVNGVKEDFYTTKSVADEIKASGEGLYVINKRDSDDYASDVDLLVAVTDKDGKFYQNVGQKSTNYATSAKSGTIALNSAASNLVDGATYGGEENSQTSFSYDDSTIFVVAELKGSNNDTDKVYVGSVSDIETADDNADRDEYTTSVYVFVADDETKATPYAEVVLVVKPNSDYKTTDNVDEGDDDEDEESAITGVETTNKKTTAAIKKLAPGAYVLDAMPTDDLADDINGNIEDNIFFVFNLEAKSTAELVIYDEDGNEVYTETANNMDAGKHFFYVQILGDFTNGTSHPDEPLASGEYSWDISVSSDIIVEGFFTVE